jgi:hypothetical protein
MLTVVGFAQNNPVREKPDTARTFVPVTDEMLWKPNPAD